ncbi:MAG TPA: FMN-binding protein [Blastocatellia bacterium]|jgi:Na+-translocating ferredoxin:NAD+ oxidoreductase RnfG subunit|nr:FMN-binding protein [Blastocatellia bacterium]
MFEATTRTGIGQMVSRDAGRALKAALLLAASIACAALNAQPASAQTFLTLEQAPKAVFPEADSFEQRKIISTSELRSEVLQLVGRKPSIWEPFYYAYIARRGGELIGYAIVCEEIGRDRPITFIVGANPDGGVKDVAVMAYRETRGGEVRYPAFTRQFKGKSLRNPIQGQGDIRNITGATLSVRAMATGVRKALAVIQLTVMKG